MSTATTCNYPRLDDTAQRLLWKIANAVYGALGSGGSPTCSSESGAGAPTIAPTFIGQLYHDTTADAYYRSTGLTVADWVAVGSGGTSFVTTTIPGQESLLQVGSSGDLPGVTAISGNAVTSLGGFVFQNMTNMTALAFPNLVSIDPANTRGGQFYTQNDPALLSISAPELTIVGGDCSHWLHSALAAINFPKLTTVGGEMRFSTNAVLASVALPLFVSVGSGFIFSDCPALVSVSLPNWVPVDGTTITFNGDALDAASVEGVLRRCALAGVTACVIDLGGGTNAGLTSLSAQGQADVAALTLAGNTVTTNP